ncbi:hypothetical protein BU16DRAFT_181017 [Lophium mytilinum]|uniref:Uncharacterized protein n=1 Tax=Lophium mytilinum TaxID=390894 RepID=A0A6A6QAD7_9PEZI|nr:hypothetical protein BU16DRAFT_181017 [Lophium mytilinum]
MTGHLCGMYGGCSQPKLCLRSIHDVECPASEKHDFLPSCVSFLEQNECYAQELGGICGQGHDSIADRRLISSEHFCNEH